jgi:tetratricopeptide (TPR) repeat protein
LLELQRDIALDVASALQVALTPQPHRVTSAGAEAHDLFLHGRYLFHRRAPGDLTAAERYLDQAVRLDPGNARAWTALAGVIAARAVAEMDDATYRLADQHRALQRALQIDPALAEAHIRMGRYYRLTGERIAAQKAFERAAELAPDDPLVILSQATQALLAGRIDAAIALERRAQQIDPLSTVYRVNFAQTLLGAGRYDEALVELRRARELVPGIETHVDISRALLLQGDREAARRESRSVPEGRDRDQLRVLLDETPEAESSLERLQSDRSVRSLVLLAEIAAFNGDFSAAFAHLEAALPRVLAPPGPGLDPSERIAIWKSPFLRVLHDDPRWRTLTAQLASR